MAPLEEPPLADRPHPPRSSRQAYIHRRHGYTNDKTWYHKRCVRTDSGLLAQIRGSPTVFDVIITLTCLLKCRTASAGLYINAPQRFLFSPFGGVRLAARVRFDVPSNKRSKSDYFTEKSREVDLPAGTDERPSVLGVCCSAVNRSTADLFPERN
jgi:hypothetical protein